MVVDIRSVPAKFLGTTVQTFDRGSFSMGSNLTHEYYKECCRIGAGTRYFAEWL